VKGSGLHERFDEISSNVECHNFPTPGATARISEFGATFLLE